MAKKTKVPKRIAGIKVPKTLRKSPVLVTLLGSETGRQVLGNALVAGATAAAAALARSQEDNIASAGKAIAKRSRKGGDAATRAVKDATGAMVGVITEAAQAALPDQDQKATRRPRARERRVTH